MNEINKQIREKGSINVDLGESGTKAALTMNAYGDFILMVADKDNKNSIWMDEDEIINLVELLTKRKELRDRWEAL